MIIALTVLTLIISVIVLLVLLTRKNGGDDRLLSDKLVTYERNLKDEFAQNRKEMSEANRASRTDTTAALMAFQAAVNNKLDTLTKISQDSFLKQLQMVQSSLKHIQESNEKKLEEMRVTVDEKLQSTLEKRLTSSFELVTKQLEAVQKGLG